MTNRRDATHSRAHARASLQLQSIDDEERELACRTLASTAVHDVSATLALLAQPGVLTKLIARLVDSRGAVRLAACGCLRNLVQSGGFAFCEQLVKQNCMPPLLAAFAAAHENAFGAAAAAAASSTTTTATESVDEQRTLVCELVELIGYLCEASDDVTRETLAGGRFVALLVGYSTADDAGDAVLRVRSRRRRRPRCRRYRHRHRRRCMTCAWAATARGDGGRRVSADAD